MSGIKKYRHPSETRKHKSTGVSQKDLCSKDFFKCINAQWLRTVSIPPFLSSFGVSEELEKQIESHLFQIAYSCQKEFQKNHASSSIRTMIGCVVESVLKTSVQHTNISFLRKLLSTLNCIRTPEDIASSMGDMARHKISTFLEIEGKFFDKHDKKYTISLRRGKIGLPDRLYYEDTSPGRWKTLHYYKEFLKKLGDAFEIPNLSDIIPLEKQLAPYILMKRVTEEEEAIAGTTLAQKFSHIPWDAFFEPYGLPDWKKRVFAVESIEWLELLDTLFQKEDVSTWKLFLQSQVLLHFVAYLPPPYDDYHYEFYRKRLRGQAQKLPQKYLMLEVLTEWFTPFLSKLYVEEFESKELKRDATAFAKELQEAACDRLANVKWMTPATREKAIDKVKSMRLSIAYPESFGSLPLPEVSEDCLVENLLHIGAWHTKQDIEKLGIQRDNEKGWDDPVYAVNAYYYGEANELRIPIGSLLDPFYSETRPLGWNYGGVGAIIGHEMTHAFDEEGKEYNPKGFRESWWTHADEKKYEDLSKKVISIYSSQKVLGHSVDGESTLSENLADLGGVAIALDALRLRLEKENASLNEQKQAYKRFFTSYAVSWRVKERPEKQLQGLLVDRHSPTPLRVNLVVNQFQEWYDAFEIPETAQMYVPPDKRLRIF